MGYNVPLGSQPRSQNTKILPLHWYKLASFLAQIQYLLDFSTFFLPVLVCPRGKVGAATLTAILVQYLCSTPHIMRAPECSVRERSLTRARKRGHSRAHARRTRAARALALAYIRARLHAVVSSRTRVPRYLCKVFVSW